MPQLIEICSSTGEVAEPVWLAKAERVHRQLRPNLPEDYAGKMKRVFAGGGRLCAAVQDGEVAGVAVYRILENTAYGSFLYVDDLITDERSRSGGIGKALLGHLQAVALRAKCENFVLDSGTWRHEAHKFYFREGMAAVAFHFRKVLTGAGA